MSLALKDSLRLGEEALLPLSVVLEVDHGESEVVQTESHRVFAHMLLCQAHSELVLLIAQVCHE